MNYLLVILLCFFNVTANAQDYKSNDYVWALSNYITTNIVNNQQAASSTSHYTPPSVYTQPQTFTYPPYTYTVQPTPDVPQASYSSGLPTAINPPLSALPDLPSSRMNLPRYPAIQPIYIQP